MESIYYVMCWACHRRCRHCYEERFRPYVRERLEAVIAEAERNFPRIIDHLPPRMTYLDSEDANAGAPLAERTGRIVLSGGEALLDGLRQRVTYPVIERLTARYNGNGGVRVVLQTTGDLLDERLVDELLARGTWMISVASVDDFHVGLEGAARQAAFVERLSRLFEARGMRRSGLAAAERKWQQEDGPVYSFFGATPDAWIGKLWPRGRAWRNGLSSATLADSFCNRWSGGLGFLNHRYSGSEVSIEPDGSVYPCCVKTRLPLGNLVDEALIPILDSLVGEPAFEAINMGHPERMGIAEGWGLRRYLDACSTRTPDGRPYRNLCIGCDAYHEQMLGPVLARARARRRAPREPGGVSAQGALDRPASGAAMR